MFRGLKVLLEQEFEDDVEVVAQMDEGKTGNFEVTILQTGQLIHSKMTRGQGRCEDSAEQQLVIDFVKEYIDNA
jgi:hypothetical protein